MSRILVVDDEEGVRSFLAESLELDGHQIEEAESGEQALVRLRARSFDLVLTDLRMPGMDGMQLLEKVQAEQPEVEFIVLTAHGNVESAVTAFLIRVSSAAVNPATPALSWTRRTSIESAFAGLIRIITASTMTVRGAPLAPSKKTTFQLL